MRVLLTGASGNIGSNALRSMIEQGHRVRALVPDLQKDNVPPEYQIHPDVEVFPGDIRDADRMEDAVSEQDVIVHLAYIIPPLCDEKPELARAVNLDGTRNLLDAALKQDTPPRFLFASTFDLFGDTSQQEPPRRPTDPVVATDMYTEHKLQGETWVKESGLTWCILRFSDVPIVGDRGPHPIMFEIPLSQRFEVIHSADAGLAIANVIPCEEAWNRVLLIGGGEACQLTYGEYLFSIMECMGLGKLPEDAFTNKPYCTDWLDTSESQALLQYQRHTFADILRETRAQIGARRHITRLLRPLVMRYILRMSPYR